MATGTRLSVNINKVATLRNSRDENVPDVVRVARDCEIFGAQGITVHPRPDERHIRRSDVRALSGVVQTEFNIEGYPDSVFLNLVEEVKPAQVTLVPDAPEAVTSNIGWDVVNNVDFLRDVVLRLKNKGIRVSIFVDPDPRQIEAAASVGADRVELYTKPYAENFGADPQAAVEPYRQASALAQELGLGVNAGHDLNLANLKFLAVSLPRLDEVSIGHALISDALYYGLRDTIARYRACLPE